MHKYNYKKSKDKYRSKYLISHDKHIKMIE